MAYVLALLMGIVAGMRAMTAPAVVSWAAYVGAVNLSGVWLAVLGHRWAPWVLTLLALAELVTDQLPSTPSRTVPIQFGTRLVSGALCGAAIGVVSGSWIWGALAGIVGAIIGTLGGRQLRLRMAIAIGRDRPAALIEDAIAIGGAFLIALALP